MGRKKSHPILRADKSTKLRSLLLDQFDPNIATQLIEFGKFLASLDVDVLVFMARKSLCLYDILLAIGIPPSERIVISDRALDLNTAALMGKRIALIDDTLIVGTTIAKTKELLNAIPNTTVSVHVFCIDTEWQVDSLVKPDTVFLRADDRTVMHFCAGLVRAMSLLPRPYLVDFPLTAPFRIRSGDLQCLLSATSWQAYHLSSPLQMMHNAETYTLIPNPESLDQYFASTSPELRQCFEIVKIRLFGRWHEDILWLRAVPIVTLLPLKDSTIDSVASVLLEKLIELAPTSELLRRSLQKPLAKQRFIQFVLSVALGKAFFADLKSSIGSNLHLSFDDDDIDRHYGPWLYRSMADCIDHAEDILALATGGDALEIRPTSVPHLVRELAKEVLDASKLPKITHEETSHRRNVVADCCTLFTQMYRIRELPARREAQRLGRDIMSAPAIDAPYRDRLNVGLPWTAVVEFVRRLSGAPADSSHFSLVSLALDVCNDLGIVVPITCSLKGITFRAYRYGEDAPFGDAELRLAYESVRGYLSSTKRDSISRLSLEKLLVFLLRAGVATNMLKPFYGQSGMDGTVRVAFHLKGAIVLMSRGARDRADTHIWLSRHLCERGTLTAEENGHYQLGSPPEADGNTKQSINQAKQLGLMLGHCIKTADGIHDDAPLDDRSLIVLMTCCTPHHAAAAIEVELDLFREWYKSTWTLLNNKVRWDNVESIDYAFSALIRSSGYEAIHSACLKYRSFSTKEVPKLIKRCSRFLGNIDTQGLLPDIWDAAWDSIMNAEVEAHKIQLSPLLNEASSLVCEIGVCLTGLEIALAAEAVTLATKKAANISGVGDLTPDKDTLAEVLVTEKLTSATKTKLKRSMDKMSNFIRKDLPADIEKLSRLGDMDVDKVLGFEKKQLATACLKRLDSQVTKIDFLLERMEPVIEQYGRVRGRHIFRYFLYYDIVDSTATIAAHGRKDTESRERIVFQIKQAINKRLRELSITARKHRCEVFCTRGNVNSYDDGKHIFFSGKLARKYVDDCMQQLLLLTQSFPGIYMRMYSLPCGFVRSQVFRYSNDEEVRGSRFWTNWSRVLKIGKKFEEQSDPEASFLLVGDQEYLKDFHLPQASWAPVDALIETELAEAFRKIPIRHGPLRPLSSLLSLAFPESELPVRRGVQVKDRGANSRGRMKVRL